MELKKIRIVRRVFDWYAMLTFKANIEIPNPLPHGEPLGINFGLESYSRTSSNKFVPRPKFWAQWQREIQLLQRQLNHKKKGSSRWNKIKYRIAKLCEERSHTRKGFFYTGKKELRHRIHQCQCGYRTNRDFVAAQVIMQRGLSSVGQTQKMLVEGKVFGGLIND